jgi:hypothetical protein
MEKSCFTSLPISSNTWRSLRFWRGHHSCKVKTSLKTTSAGWRGKTPSIDNLLWVNQSAQDWATNKVQSKRFALGFRVARMLDHSCLELGDQFTLNMSLSPLHKNWWRGSSPAMPMFAGFRFMERFVGSGKLDGDQIKAEGHRVLPRFGPLSLVTTYVLLVWLYLMGWLQWRCYNGGVDWI